MKYSDLLFLQETWLDSDEQPELEKKYENNKFASYFKCSSQYQYRTSGRPSGGIAWIISQTLPSKIEFINERITTCVLTNLEIKIVLIGVYLTSNGQKDSNLNPEHELIELESLIEKFEDYEVIILGDANCDLKRNNTHDKHMINRKC